MPLIDEDAAQHGFTFRFGWGAEGLAALAPVCEVVVPRPVDFGWN